MDTPMRKLLAFALAALTLTGTAKADQTVDLGRIDNSDRVMPPGGPPPGRWQDDRDKVTPDNIENRGQDSSNDVSNMRVIPRADAAIGTLAKTLSPLGPSQANPYAPGAYPSWAQGVGSQYGGYTGYYDVKPLATSNLYLPGGSTTLFNPFTYGSLQTGGVLTLSTNVNRPGCVQGFTHPGQSAGYDEFGAYAFCAQVDSTPLMANAAGTFTATGFTPSTPIVLSDTVKIGVGMWLRTDDAPAQFNGQVTSWLTNAQGAVTAITVSGWYKRGAAGVAETPRGTHAYLNPRDKIWGVLNTPFQNGLIVQGTTTAGSSIVTMESVDGLYPNGQLLEGVGIPINATFGNIDYAGKRIFLNKTATANGTVPLTFSSGTDSGKFVGEEIDLFNAGVAFTPTWIGDVTGDITAGDYVVRNITGGIQAWRPGILIYGAGIPVGTVVTSVNIANNTATMKAPATATALGVALRGKNQLDEGGTGIDCAGITKNSNTCYLQRGSVSYGFLSMGAGDTSFLAGFDYFAAQPRFGFRTDGKLNGHASVADFAVTNNDAVLWKVDGAGNETAQSVDSATGYKIAGTSVIDNSPWTLYTPIVTCNAGAISRLTSATGRYKRIGKTVFWQAQINIAAKGTCSASLNVSTPLPVHGDFPLTGRDGASGAALVGILPNANSNAIVQRYDGTFPIVVPGSSSVLVSATYETQ